MKGLMSGRSAIRSLLALTVTTAISTGAAAATFDVPAGSTADLINAINAANATPAADTINLGAGSYRLIAVDNEASGPNGLPSIRTDITLNGASLGAVGGITTVIARIATAPKFRLLHVAGTGRLTLNRVRIRGGDVSEVYIDDPDTSACFDPCGGGLLIEENGRATLSYSHLANNHGGESGGGGAWSLGTLNLYNSTVSGGRTLTSGGGIVSTSSGSLSVVQSTLRGNQADESGGALVSSGSLYMANSTVSGNRTTDGRPSGGGVNVFGSATLDFVTIVDNVGGGLRIGTGSGTEVRLSNSIVANNRIGGDDTPLDCDGTVLSGGFNLIGSGDQCTIDTSGAAGPDLLGGPGTELDPVLGRLRNNSAGNGGTATHEPQPGSPTIDAARPRDSLFRALFRTTDQRGFVRVSGARDDIGAHESAAPPGCWPSTLGMPTTPIWPILALLLGGPRAATVVGGAGNDTLTGTPGPDVIHGLGGNDRLTGLFGNDLICGGPGDDSLDGGGSNDTLNGEDGADSLFGGPGDDKLEGGPGGDLCNGQAHDTGDLQRQCETALRIP